MFLPGRSFLTFGGHVEINWKFTVMGSSDYRRYPAYDTVQRRPLVFRTVGKRCMCTSQCSDCSSFRLICFRCCVQYPICGLMHVHILLTVLRPVEYVEGIFRLGQRYFRAARMNATLSLKSSES